MEVTLRTDIAFDVIKLLDREVKAAVIGVGSVRTPSELEQATTSGAKFAVSPGSEASLIEAAENSPIPFLFGAATPSEVMNLLARGFAFQKFFPAAINGGIKALKAFSGPLSQVTFCPTGGVNPSNAADYLALPNVACVGGSWMVPRHLIETRDWSGIERLSVEAAAIS